MAAQITLTLDNGTYNVLRCNYVFNRDVDYRGRPTTGLLGGDIKIEIETTGDDYLWERLSGRKPRPVSGKLEIFDAEAMSPIRVLEWYDGYIYAVEEGMYSLSALPMTQKVLITTKRMDINSVVKLDRRFPETYGFWWEEYKEPAPVVAVEEESEVEEDTAPHILSAAWLDEEDNPIILIPSGLEETVTMHIETTGFDKPENDEEDVLIQIKDNEKNVFFEYTTRPNQEGVIDLDLTVEEIISERHDKPTEYLKEHPNLKLSLIASLSQEPEDTKEATLGKEIECTLLFRRPPLYDPKKYPTNYYNGSFFFDWVRIEDTKDSTDPMDYWYKDYMGKYDSGRMEVVVDEKFYYNFIANNYCFFRQEWRTKYKKWEQTADYYIPWLKINKDQKIELLMKYITENYEGKITFSIVGREADFLKILSDKEIEVNSHTVENIKERFQLECNGIITEITSIEAYAGTSKVGQIYILPNKIEPLNVEVFYINFEYKKEPLLINESVWTVARRLLRQANIEADFKQKIEWDLTNEKEGPGETSGSLLGLYFFYNGSIYTDEKLDFPEHQDKDYKDYNIFKYLTEKLKGADEKFSKPREIISGKTLKLFVICVPGKTGSPHRRHRGAKGYRQIKGRGNEETQSAIIFNNLDITTGKSDATGNMIAHEILHCLGLDHPFEDEKYAIKKYYTDNIMDYISEGDIRISLWKYQLDKVQKYYKKHYRL